MTVLSNLMSSFVSQQQSAYRKTEAKKETLLEDPKKLDDYVGKVFQQVSPSKKTASSSKAAFLTDRVNAYIPENHPMKNFGQELKERLSRELANPDNAGVSAKEITTGITKWMLEQPDEKTGMSRLKRSYELQRLNQTSRNLLTLGLMSGEDKSLKAPLGLPGMLTYNEWRQGKYAAEQELTRKEYEKPGAYGKAIGKSAAIGGGIGAAIGTFTAPGVGTAVEGALGAASMAVLETVAFPLRKVFEEKTEWASARKHSSRVRDHLKLLGVELGPELAIGVGAEKAILKTARFAAGAKALAVAKPTASTIVNAAKAEKIASTEVKKALAVAKKGGEGESTLIKTLSEEEEALAFARGEKTADQVASSRLGKKGKTKRTSSAELEAASKAVGQEWSKGAIPVRTGGGSEELAKVLREIERDAEVTLVGEGGEPSGLTRALFPEKYGRRASDKSAEVVDRRTAVREGEVDRRSPLSHDYVDYVGQLEVEMFGRRISEISKDPVAREALELIGRQSQAEALANVDEPKAIDELIDYFGAGGKVTAEQTAPKLEPEIEKVYNEIGDYHDSLLKKYYPNLELDSASAAMQKKVGRAVRELDSKLTAEERKTLDTMIDKYESIGGTVSADTEKAAEITDKLINPISSKEARKVGADIARRETSGSISKIQAVDEFENLLTRVEASTEMEAVERMDIFHAVSQILTGLKKQANLVTFLAAFGVGSGVFQLFSPDEAEAGVLSSIGKVIGELTGKAATREAELTLMRTLASESRIVPKILDDTTFFIPEKGFQVGFGDSAAGGPSKVIRNMAKYAKNPKELFGRAAMSVDQQIKTIINIEEGVMNDPAVSKVSYVMSEDKNIKNGLRVMSNILKAAGVKSAKKEVSTAMDGIASLQKAQVGFDYYTTRVGDLTQQLRKLSSTPKKTRFVIDAIKDTKQQLAIARKNIAKYKPGLEQFHREWAKVAEPLAREYSSTRIFLAADDDMVKWSKYPFMKDIKLSRTEELAAGRIKRQMAEYKVRLEREGIDTRSGAYMHYTLHPKVNAAMMEDITGNIGTAPYLKNYSRSLNSRPLMPDVYASMSHYIPDVERRLQNQAYWNAGWRKVANKAKRLGIEPLRTAFEALEKGTAPIERSWGNTAATWYTIVEIVKRLAFLPSAGLKHLIKFTGNMASLGIKEASVALPSSIKGVSWRVVENTPFLKKIANKYFSENASEYAKLKKTLLDSVVPAMDTRWRMSQMGFGDYETYFNKLQIAADQVAHAGGVWITLAENIDRGAAMEAGLRIAAKKGMTADQALYGIYDTILTNNFLGREFTPRWLRNPKVNALLLFQKTPFKIMQRRVVNAIRTGRAVKNMGRAVKEATKTPEGRQQLVTDLRNLWKDMKNTERELKVNLFLDTIRSEVDFYGNAIAKQFAKDILIIGAGTGIGASAGYNLWHHFFHVPFIKTSYISEDYGLAISPGLNAVLKGSNDWANKDYNDPDFLTTKIIKEWMGRSGVLPDIVNKLNRLDKGDIPEIYKDDKFKYLFSIPAKEE